jgi:RNA polymerase sigma-70 factor (ECF subfamily)
MAVEGRWFHSAGGDDGPPQAEDVVQDAFASALLRWPVLRSYHDPEAWVRRVAFRRAIDHHRRSARQLRAVLRLGPPPSLPPVGAEHVDLVRALRKLPVGQREVLVLHYVAELAVDRVAAGAGAAGRHGEESAGAGPGGDRPPPGAGRAGTG